jgi:antitoxin component of MazEF toxin-antitoxin module
MEVDMTKKLIKHGNSLALVIDKPILEVLNVSGDTPFEITTDGRNLILSPQSEGNGEQDIIKSLEKINAKFGNALRRLGE